MSSEMRDLIEDWRSGRLSGYVGLTKTERAVLRVCASELELRLARTEAGPSLLCQSDACAHKGTAHNFCTPRTEAGADGYDDGSGRVRDWRESDTRPQDASGDVVPVLFGRDADADWYVDAGTKSICVDVDFDPARQLSLILKQDGTVAWSIFVQEPDSSTTKATGPSVMNPGFYEALSYIAMQAKEAK